MLKITIPNNNIEERKYILDIILDEFLGLDFKTEIKNEKEQSDWIIELENRNKLIIQDHFFNKYKNDLEYLELKNIPAKVDFIQNEFTNEKNIITIYGNSKIETINQEFKTIVCKVDIFASSFFMLTRWEEHVNEKRDNHNRFSAYDSMAYKNNFLERPIVDEYVYMLKNMLHELGLKTDTLTTEKKLMMLMRYIDGKTGNMFLKYV
jgi:hypothetical protein